MEKGESYLKITNTFLTKSISGNFYTNETYYFTESTNNQITIYIL